MEYNPYNTIENVPSAVFEDGAYNAPIKNLIFNIDVKQDGEGDVSYDNVRIFKGETSITITDVGSYDSYEETIDFPNAAGTVYGGTIDIINGKLTVDRAIVTFDGTENWSKRDNANPNGTYFALDYNHSFVPFSDDLDAKSSMEIRTTTSGLDRGNGFYWIDNPKGFRVLYGATGGEETLANFKDYLEGLYTLGTPFQICGKLATPIVYDIDPQILYTFYLENNISADVGTVNKITYKLDRVMYYRRYFMINSGYILVNADGVDLTSQSSKTIDGFHKKCEIAMETGKPIFIYNAIYGSGKALSPIPVFSRYGESSSIILTLSTFEITVTTADAVTITDLTDDT